MLFYAPRRADMAPAYGAPPSGGAPDTQKRPAFGAGRRFFSKKERLRGPARQGAYGP